MPIILIPSKNIYDVSNDKLPNNTITAVEHSYNNITQSFGNILPKEYSFRFFEKSTTDVEDIRVLYDKPELNEGFSFKQVPSGSNLILTATLSFPIDKATRFSFGQNSNGESILTSHKIKSTRRLSTDLGETFTEYTEVRDPIFVRFASGGEFGEIVLSYSLHAVANGNYVLSDTISLEGNYLSTKESSQTIGAGDVGLRIPSNELVQSGNSDLDKYADDIILEYAHGKEIATILCSVNEYYDENGDIVISTKTSDKMIFEVYDKVVPMIKTGSGNDEAMSYNSDGSAKVFDVIGTKMIYDGAVWQELTLIESSESVEIPTAEKLATPQISISQDLLTIFDRSGKAEQFEILVDGSVYRVISADQKTLDLSSLNLDYGSYKITVIAIANDYINSSQSNAVSYTIVDPNIQTLPTPLLTLEGDTLYIYGGISNAEKFDVWVNGSVRTTITSTTFNLSTLNLGVGTFTIFVVARASGYNDSAQSDTVTYIVEKKTLLLAGKYVFNETPDLSKTIIQPLNIRITVGSSTYTITNISVGSNEIAYTTAEGNKIVIYSGSAWDSENLRNIELLENAEVTTSFYEWFFQNVSKQKITFSIGEKSYTADAGMSWYQWCNSSYNVDKWLVKANTATEQVYRYTSSTTVEAVYDENVKVSAIDKIVQGTVYVTREEFSQESSSAEILEYVDENFVKKDELKETIEGLDLDGYVQDTELAETLKSYDNSTTVDNKISTALTSYDKTTVVEQKLASLQSTIEKWVEEQDYTTDREVTEKIAWELAKWADVNLGGYATDVELEQAIVNALASIKVKYVINDTGKELNISGYASRTEMQSSIEAGMQSLTVEYTKKFDSLEIGGRNLYTNSSDFSGNKWANLNRWQTDTNVDAFGNVIKYSGAWYGLFQPIMAKAGETYTLSATVFGDGSCTAAFVATENSANRIYVKTYKANELSADGTRVYATYTVKTDSELAFRIENTVDGSIIKISSPKLEKGNKATDWTKAPEDNDEEFAKLSTDLGGEISNLQMQIDGAITSWFYEVPPTTDNEPAVNWQTSEQKNIHLGDLYYDTLTGYCYRWQIKNNVYSWERITDTDVTKALEAAQNAQDTADKKRRVFVTTPKPPYDIGDLWVQGSEGDIMRCQQPKAQGQSYVATDWVKASKYIDNTQAGLTAEQKIQQTQIGGRNLAYYTGIADSIITHGGVIINSGNTPLSHRWNITKNTTYDGTVINPTIFTAGETYTISYFIRKTAGTLSNIGGHISGFTQKRLSIDGKETSSLYDNGVSISNDTAIHYIVLTVKYNGGTENNAFYIQPNRGYTTTVTYDLWNIKVEKGEKATDFTPAWEEYYTTAETQAQIKAHADRIVLGVKEEINTTLSTDYYNKTQTESQIQVATNNITQSVSQTYSTKTELGTAISTVEGKIVLGIGTDGNGKKYSYLNANADYIKFNSGDLEISSTQFTLDKNGNATFKGTLSAATGEFSGIIHAAGGDIGGVQIGNVATKGDVTSAQTTATSNAVALVEQKGYATTTQVSTAKSEAISAAASDATTKANNAQTNAISTASTDATQKANQAKSDAISSASADATNKANAARTNAVNDVKALGYQTLSDIKLLGYQTKSDVEALGYQTAGSVTQIIGNTVNTGFVNALGITAAVANIANSITVGDVFSANSTSGTVSMAGWTVNSNSLFKQITSGNWTYKTSVSAPASLTDDAFSVIRTNASGSSVTAFSINGQGDMVCTSGKIAKWNIYDGTLYSGSGDNKVSLYARDLTSSETAITIGNSGARKDWRIVAGNKFGVTKDGSFYATAGSFGDLQIGEDSLQIVNSDGNLKLYNVGMPRLSVNKSSVYGSNYGADGITISKQSGHTFDGGWMNLTSGNKVYQLYLDFSSMSIKFRTIDV